THTAPAQNRGDAHMTLTFTKLTFALTAAAALSSAALAQQEPRTPPATPEAATQTPPTAPTQPVDVGGIFDKLDVNHDGKLTPEEAQAHPTVTAHFKDADANG